MTGAIRVLVVEDEPVAAEAHRQYVARVPGFVVVGVAHTGADAVRALASSGAAIDLVLLDMHLPDRHGLDVVRAMRASGHPADVIAVTSARELGVVRAAVSQGIVQYLLKPFTFSALRDRLERYAEFRARVAASEEAPGQEAVDRVMAALRGSPSANPLPKGLTPQMLDAVAVEVRREPEGLSASEVADRVGTSRVTARRYLEYLAEAGTVHRTQRYGGPGRPEVAYRWAVPR